MAAALPGRWRLVASPPSPRLLCGSGSRLRRFSFSSEKCNSYHRSWGKQLLWKDADDSYFWAYYLASLPFTALSISGADSSGHASWRALRGCSGWTLWGGAWPNLSLWFETREDRARYRQHGKLRHRWQRISKQGGVKSVLVWKKSQRATLINVVVNPHLLRCHLTATISLLLTQNPSSFSFFLYIASISAALSCNSLKSVWAAGGRSRDGGNWAPLIQLASCDSWLREVPGIDGLGKVLMFFF